MKIEIITSTADNPVAEFFSSSSTPETDTFAAHMSEEFIDPSWLKFSQELERERDEIKEKYRFAVIHWQVGAAKMERERDEAREERNKIQTELEMWRDGNILHEIHRNELEKVERERDEAQERIERQKLEIVRLNSATNHAGGTPLKIALRKRDEAREMAQQMSESNQALMADVRFYRNAWEQLKEIAR